MIGLKELRIIHREPGYEPTPYDDDWEDVPASGPVGKWFGGVIVPLLFVSYGVNCLLKRHGVLRGEYNISMELYGSKALVFGLASASLGLFLHCHYFWGNLYHMSALAVLGKIASLITLIGSLGYLFIRIWVLGR